MRGLTKILLVLLVISLSVLLISGAHAASLYSNSASCKKISVSGSENNIIFRDKSQKPMAYYQEMAKAMKEMSPYNEYKFNYYLETRKNACKIKTTKSTVVLEVRDISPYLGYTIPSRNGKPTQVLFDDSQGWKWWRFLLFHELGHAYGIYWHTDNSTIMCNCGPTSQEYSESQKDIIRGFLK